MGPNRHCGPDLDLQDQAGDGPLEWVRPVPKAPERSWHASGPSFRPNRGLSTHFGPNLMFLDRTRTLVSQDWTWADLGRLWPTLGRGLGRSWANLGPTLGRLVANLGSTFGRLLANRYRTLGNTQPKHPTDTEPLAMQARVLYQNVPYAKLTCQNWEMYV